ncbi:HAD family hydrolase [Limosilactobacillus albertensis]|uniref:HAD family phosphatase n=1 Tax=Limosilactobacillus albertensis TaxID=2759752 RepID=A0A839H0B4_9LACO|nr:HAD family hydrolase [Limosilactobacillus albertensis]MBB1123361.1 HAD family phosphatase [Limosilactobacillus albertensis]MCD7121226.1 Cof-type HAD-IIB family hydrolase [Limosilactobacillus albertensis]
MKKYGFIAVDIDGTLLDDNDHFDIKRFNKDVALLQQAGYHFIIASGNSYDALTTIFRPCPLVKEFVAENGGRIVIDQKSIYNQTHSKKTLQQVLSFINEKLPKPDILSLSGRSQTIIANQYRDVPVPYYPHHTYFTSLEEINEPIYNLNIGWAKQKISQEVIQDYVKQLNRFCSAIQATYSGAYGIDILPAGVNKARGLKELVERYLNGTLAQVVAFGDTSNDIEMLTEAGCGIAMKNATSDLLKVADKVTINDNNHDGLLTEIEQLFLS